jgi:multicomponent Na+:H+ antiporter subunit E
MTKRAVVVVWLVVVWVLLWGELSAANVITGAVIGAALVMLFTPELSIAVAVRPLAIARFAIVFTWRLIVASAIVAYEVITPRNRITEGIVAVPIRGASDLLITIVANATSLTPGTLTIEVLDRNTLFVHVLHLRDIEMVRRSIRRLEELAIQAFGSAEAIASLAEPMTSQRVRDAT